MPQAVFVTIGLALESSAGAWIVANAAALSSAAISIGAIAANAAYSADQQRKAARAQTAAYNASLKDREVMIRSAIAPRRIVYGRDKISGPIVFAQSTGAKGEFLHLVIALADGECEAIEEIYFNDILLPTPDGSGYIQSGEFAHNTTTAHSGGPYTPSSGTVTLPQAASKVVSVSRVTVANDVYTDVAVTGWAHTPGSASVTGCGVGACYVNYETSAATPRVRIKKHLGQAGQVADAALVSESGGKWTSAMVGTGVCYLYVRLEYDTDVWGQVGIPNISCVVKGRKLYDPRSATTVWSENAALIARDYLRDATNGLGAAAGEVIDAEVNAAANICDELVTLTAGGATQKRYTFNGSVTTEVSPRDNLADLLTGMAGSAVWVQGRWLLRAGAYRTPAMTITEDYLAGDGVSISANTTRASLFNAVRATYRDTAQAWAEVQAPLVENATYQSDDGGKQLVRAISLPGAMENMRAQRLAKIELERARQALTVQLTTNLKGYDLAPTDTVALTLVRYGFSAKVFEVVQRVWSAEGTLQYTLRETAAGVWAWNYGEATTVDLAPNTTLPNPYAKPAAITGLGVASGTTHLMRLSDGTIITRAFCTWTASAAAFVQDGGSIELGWKRPTEADWQAAPPLPGNATSGYLQPVPDSTLILVRVRAVNAAGRPSDWATVQYTVVGKSAAPSNVAGLSAAMAEGGVLVTWTPCPDVDYAETELRYGASWAAGTQLFVGNASKFFWPRPSAGAYTLRAKHRDTSGIDSASESTGNVTVTALGAVTWASITGRPQQYRVGSTGWASTTHPVFAGLYDGETGAEVVTSAYGYRVAKINRSTGAVVNVGGFAPFINGLTDANAMAAAIDAIGSDHFVIVFSQDEPHGGRLLGNLPAAMYRCGASPAIFGSPQFQYRGAYILIGIGGCGMGNGFESYAGAVSSDTNAWCDVSFQVLNGNFIVSGTSGTPRTLADYSYIGDLDATYGATTATLAVNAATEPSAHLKASDTATHWSTIGTTDSTTGCDLSWTNSYGFAINAQLEAAGVLQASVGGALASTGFGHVNCIVNLPGTTVNFSGTLEKLTAEVEPKRASFAFVRMVSVGAGETVRLRIYPSAQMTNTATGSSVGASIIDTTARITAIKR